MELVTDLSYLASLAPSARRVIQELKEKIRHIPVTRFDEVAHPVVEEITAQIDCTTCGNCCRHQEPGVTPAEIETLANAKHMLPEDFKDHYVAWDREGVSFLCKQPCVFLAGNRCSVYTLRPASCADFPGLHRPRLKWRLPQVEENYSICPIVYNVVEKLRQIL